MPVRNLAVLAAVSLAALASPAAQKPDPADAESLARKLQDIRKRHAEGADKLKRFDVTEDEANAYLVYRVADQLPEEVTAPWVRFGEDQVEGGAMVDLGRVGKTLSGSSLSQLLSGQVPVEVTAEIQADGGVGRVDLQTVTLGGLPLPRTLLQKWLTRYSKSPSRPNGVNLDDPFPLPFGIVSARVRTGKLILQQGATEVLVQGRGGPGAR